MGNPLPQRLRQWMLGDNTMYIQTDLFGEPPTPQTTTKAWSKAHKNRLLKYNSMRRKSSHTQDENFGKCRKVERSGKNT